MTPADYHGRHQWRPLPQPRRSEARDHFCRSLRPFCGQSSCTSWRLRARSRSLSAATSVTAATTDRPASLVTQQVLVALGCTAPSGSRRLGLSGSLGRPFVGSTRGCYQPTGVRGRMMHPGCMRAAAGCIIVVFFIPAPPAGTVALPLRSALFFFPAAQGKRKRRGAGADASELNCHQVDGTKSCGRSHNARAAAPWRYVPFWRLGAGPCCVLDGPAAHARQVLVGMCSPDGEVRPDARTDRVSGRGSHRLTPT